MLKRMSKILLLVIALSLMFTGVAYAQEDQPGVPRRAAGKITSVSLGTASFRLHTRAGNDVTIFVVESTVFRSRDGSIQGLGDLEVGMAAYVVGAESEEGSFVARLVAAGFIEDVRPIVVRATGEITRVSLGENAFTLQTRDGEQLTFQVCDRTRFRSRDGSIHGLEDLEVGMLARVGALKGEDGSLTALVVAAGHKPEPPERFRFMGEITQVIPGQETFTLQTREGREISFQVGDRTQYRSRDGSVEDIHDLKKGMVALVVAIEQEDGSWLALLVAAANPGQGPSVDVRAAGQIIALGSRSFTLRTRDGRELAISVDGSTAYRSPDGSVQSFDDLQVGMLALVGAKELGNGGLKAVYVVARNPRLPSNESQPDEGAPRTLPEGGT
ncbi:MAG: DUF5666 domain-containing protein [Anaerolineales bacterium]|jgi:hypothetical protein